MSARPLPTEACAASACRAHCGVSATGPPAQGCPPPSWPPRSLFAAAVTAAGARHRQACNLGRGQARLVDLQAVVRADGVLPHVAAAPGPALGFVLVAGVAELVGPAAQELGLARWLRGEVVGEQGCFGAPASVPPVGSRDRSSRVARPATMAQRLVSMRLPARTRRCASAPRGEGSGEHGASGIVVVSPVTTAATDVAPRSAPSVAILPLRPLWLRKALARCTRRAKMFCRCGLSSGAMCADPGP